MLCALDEIGIDEKINPMKHEDGIFEMPADAKVGDSIFSYLDMDDEIIELSITPNVRMLCQCMGQLGKLVLFMVYQFN